MHELLSKELLKHAELDSSMVTILGVETDENFEYARVTVSVFPDERREKVLEELNNQAASLRWAVMKKSKIGKMPTLHFRSV